MWGSSVWTTLCIDEWRTRFRFLLRKNKLQFVTTPSGVNWMLTTVDQRVTRCQELYFDDVSPVTTSQPRILPTRETRQTADVVFHLQWPSTPVILPYKNCILRWPSPITRAACGQLPPPFYLSFLLSRDMTCHSDRASVRTPLPTVWNQRADS